MENCWKIGVSIFLLYLCIHYWTSFTGFLGTLIGSAAPLLIGCVIAYIVNILMSFYERHYFPKSTKKFLIKSRRPICMLIGVPFAATAYRLLQQAVNKQNCEHQPYAA